MAKHIIAYIIFALRLLRSLCAKCPGYISKSHCYVSLWNVFHSTLIYSYKKTLYDISIEDSNNDFTVVVPNNFAIYLNKGLKETTYKLNANNLNRPQQNITIYNWD